MIWEAIRAVYPFDLFIVVMMVWTVIQIAGLFPSLQYWPALRVSYILPPLPEDTAHLTDKPSKKSDVKAKDSMVVRYGKVTAYELTRVERGGLFGLTLTVTQGLFLGVAFVWVLTQLPEPFTLLRSAVTPVLIMATVTCLYVLATIALLGDANTSYKWQLSAIFGIVFGSLSFAFLLENTDELLDIPLYQGLDEEFTRRFNLPLLPGEDDDDTTAFDRRQSLTRVILALVTGVLAFCHFFVSVRRAAHHHRLVYSSFHGKFFKGLEYLYLALVALLLVLWFRTPTEFLTDYLHLDQTVDDTCHAWLGTSKFGMVLCRTLSWTGLGARDLYHTARWCVQGSVVALCWLLFRPLLSAYTHRVAAVMRSLLFMHQLYGTEAGSLHGLMQREATGVMQGLGVVCVELSALPLLLTWHWHYAGHWLVDYLTFISLLAHGVTMVLTFITLALSDTDATRPAFFDTLLRWWDRRSATPRNINKKLRIKKK